jgi:hypothetical protein
VLTVSAQSPDASGSGVSEAPAGGPAALVPVAPFERIGRFAITDNLAEDVDARATPASAEIVDITADGTTLLYTDAYTGALGFVDLTDPAAPKPLGELALPGDPTSVAILGDLALVAVVTNQDPDGDGPLNGFDAPSGSLEVISVADRSTLRSIELAGQPDSVAVSPDGAYAGVIIENERDEEENGGLLPQLPGGTFQILDVAGEPDAWQLRTVDLTGLADVAPEDPEPEYVSINGLGQAVITLQENNHLVIVDLASGEVVTDFSAGTVDLTGIDTAEEELGVGGAPVLELDGTLEGRRREPDAVAWIDDDSFAIANEGDYEDADGVEGGTRGFTIFGSDGTVEYDAGAAFEQAVVSIGQFPEGRADAKGVEAEGLAVGTVGDTTYLFVGAERANVVGVYRIGEGDPVLVGILPTGIGPEGIKLTSDGLLAVTSEVDGLDEEFLARPVITLFSAGGPGAWHYPQLESAVVEGLPIPWAGISGLSGDPSDPDVLWAVSDSLFAQAWLYRIDTSVTPAVITERIPIGAVAPQDLGTGDFDLEGVAARPEGGFWLASEGTVGDEGARPNLLIRTDASGAILGSYPLPEALVAGATSSGFEGVAVTGTEAGGDEVAWVAIQREWADDAEGQVKIGRFDVASGAWTFATYQKDPVESAGGGWVGLSEVTALPDGRLAILERDNQMQQDAAIKRIYAVDPASVTFAAAGGALPVLEKELLRDILPDLAAWSITVPDKVEGLGFTSGGEVWVATDNDGTDENFGETVFADLGTLEAALGR